MAAPIKVKVFGVEYKSRSSACAKFNQSPAKIDHRMRCGMSLEDALTSPDRYTGVKKHPLYTHWNGMRSRCYSKSECSNRYKGRIVMCPDWRDNFWAFANDMSADFKKGLSLDRIDNEGDYSPSNCRWATRNQQQRNMRSSVRINAFGELLTSIEWEERHGVRAEVIRYRINRGVNPEDAITMKRINNIQKHKRIQEGVPR